MNADDLQNLYHNLRGSRSAQFVLDAHDYYSNQEWGNALDKLAQARDAYQQSRSRLIRQPAERQVDANAKNVSQQIKRIERKQRQALDLLESFEQYIVQLEKLAQRDQQRKLDQTQDYYGRDPDAQSSSNDAESDTKSHESLQDDVPQFAKPSDLTGELADTIRELEGEDRLDVIGAAFGFREVNSKDDIHPRALYVLRTDENVFTLVYTRGEDEIAHTIYLENAAGNNPIPSYSRSAFVRLGKSHDLVLLTPKSSAPAAGQKNEATDESAKTSGEENKARSKDPERKADSPKHGAIDMGSFSQLMDSAQRSGIVPGADQIGYVRDREFEKGDYDRALQLIEGMFATFTANANQHAQRLKLEDAEIASGRVKMSPKQLQAKRARDRMKTQAIERARNRFQRVLDGLRIMLRTN